MAARKTKPATQDPVIFRAPTVRNFTTWTPQKLRTAELQADGGDLSYAASVCEWLLGDDRIPGALDARLDALFGLTPKFEPGVGRKKNQAIKALEAGEDWWESYPESECRLIHSWGLLLGVAPASHRWDESDDHGGRWLPRPKFWHPQTLRFDWQTAHWSVADFRHQRHVVTPGDGEWVLHTPFGSDRPWSRGLWRSLSRWVLLKHYAIQDWARHGEKAAVLVAMAPEGATKEQRIELAEDLQASGEDAVIALAAGFDLKLVEVSANTKQIYQAQIEMADKAIAIRIRGANLSTDVEGGSRAAAESQAKSNEQPKLRFDASSFSTTIHDQSLTWWAQYNFGDSRLAPWPVYPIEPEEDRKDKSETEEKALQNLDAAEKLGLDVDRKAFLDTYGISWAKPGERPPEPQPVAPEAPPADVEADDGDGEQSDDGLNAQALAARYQYLKSRFDKIEAQLEGAPILASGASAKVNSGFVNGQEYADRLTEESARAAAQVMAPDVADVLRVVRGAKSPEDLEAKLREAYAAMDPDALSALTEKSMILARIGGYTSVLEDL